MTITQLTYVLAVAEHRNFTLAAEKCFVTQPTLSMQIQKIEDELGIQIFDRSTKPIQLTDIGQKIVHQAKNIVNESERIKDIVDQQKGFIGGEFKLGVIPTVMPTLLPMFLQTFIKKYPKVKLVLEELNTDEIIYKLKNNHLDAAIAATPLQEEKIKEIPLYYEPFVAFVPENNDLYKKNMLTPEDLKPDELLLLQDGHCFRENILNLCHRKNIQPNHNFELTSGSFETLLRLSEEGLGTTLLPYLHTLNLNEDHKTRLRYFKDPKPSREISLIFPDSELKLQIIHALKEVISGVIKGAVVFHNVDIISPKAIK